MGTKRREEDQEEGGGGGGGEEEEEEEEGGGEGISICKLNTLGNTNRKWQSVQ